MIDTDNIIHLSTLEVCYIVTHDENISTIELYYLIDHHYITMNNLIYCVKMGGTKNL